MTFKQSISALSKMIDNVLMVKYPQIKSYKISKTSYHDSKIFAVLVTFYMDSIGDDVEGEITDDLLDLKSYLSLEDFKILTNFIGTVDFDM